MRDAIRIKEVMKALQVAGFDVDYKKAAVIVCTMLIMTVDDLYKGGVSNIARMLDIDEEQALEVLEIAKQNY